MNIKKTLVLEGGGFRTAFTAGVLDSFMACGYQPFDRLIGVSGGALALSYYLSGQFKFYYKAMKHLSQDPNFIKFTRIMKPEGYMDIEYLKKMSMVDFPFDMIAALEAAQKSEVYFVATNRNTGKAEFLQPNENNWVDCVIASSTLPFVTKGRHEVNGLDLMDGGWSDPIPVQKAVEAGTEEVLIIRTNPKELKVSQSWSDYFGGIYFRENKEFSQCFLNTYDQYNASVDFMNNPPEGTKIQQLAPIKKLKSTTTSYSRTSISNDYRYGMDCGLQYIRSEKAKGQRAQSVATKSRAV